METLLDICFFSWLTVGTMLWSVSFMCPIKAVSLKPFSNTHNSHTFNLWITLKGLYKFSWRHGHALARLKLLQVIQHNCSVALTSTKKRLKPYCSHTCKHTTLLGHNLGGVFKVSGGLWRCPWESKSAVPKMYIKSKQQCILAESAAVTESRVHLAWG